MHSTATRHLLGVYLLHIHSPISRRHTSEREREIWTVNASFFCSLVKVIKCISSRITMIIACELTSNQKIDVVSYVKEFSDSLPVEIEIC